MKTQIQNLKLYWALLVGALIALAVSVEILAHLVRIFMERKQ
jgi:hypothetical protein